MNTYHHEDSSQFEETTSTNIAIGSVLFETDFADLPVKSDKEIDDIFYKYNEYAKENGFKMYKMVRRGNTGMGAETSAVFQCQVGSKWA